jgi:hypothetical protein
MSSRLPCCVHNGTSNDEMIMHLSVVSTEANLK